MLYKSKPNEHRCLPCVSNAAEGLTGGVDVGKILAHLLFLESCGLRLDLRLPFSYEEPI